MRQGVQVVLKVSQRRIIAILIDYINRYANGGISAQPCRLPKSDCQTACFSLQAA